MLEGVQAVQEGENELAEIVIVCQPEQASLMMGGLHPRGSLYERPINIDTAKAQHEEFRNQLRAHGCKVLTVREILAYNVRAQDLRGSMPACSAYKEQQLPKGSPTSATVKATPMQDQHLMKY
jgi:arginine deiminase